MQWLLQNIRVRVGFALKNPRCALSTLYGELTFSDERFLAGMCGVSPRAIRGFLDESSNTPEFAAHIANVAEEFRALSSVQRRPLAKKVLNRYAAIRTQKMKVLAGSRVPPSAMDYSISETPANFYHPYLHSRQPSHL